MSNHYLLGTGKNDYERLEIMSRHYNPPAIQFLQDSRLKPGMTVLEIGCGAGQMACDLASVVGPRGKVIATDNSPAQIETSKATAEKRGIKNIEFHICDVMNLTSLNIKVDAIYGRWVLFFYVNLKKHYNKCTNA